MIGFIGILATTTLLQNKANAVLQHNDDILKQAGLKPDTNIIASP